MKLLEELNSYPRFSHLVSHIERNEKPWMQFLASSNIEEDFPKGWENEIFENEEIATNPKKKESSKIIRDLSIVRILRPDKFLISNK